MSILRDRYFAACRAEDIGDKIWARMETLAKRPHPCAPRWAAADLGYYGELNAQGATWLVTRGGMQGELARVRVNRARAMSKARQALVTGSRVSWGVRGRNDSAADAYSTALSKQLLLACWHYDGMSADDLLWEELAEVYGEGYAFVEWDRTRGPEVSDGITTARHGDIRTTLLPPWQVMVDLNRQSAQDQDWWFIRLDRPKADLAMLYRRIQVNGQWAEGDKAAEAIFDAPPVDRLMQGWSMASATWASGIADFAADDLSTTVHFIHRPTLAMPNGRHVIMLSKSVVLRDTSLIGPDGDYEALPVIRRAADERLATTFGYTSFFDVLGAQEILDAIDTTQSTSVTTFGNPILQIEQGSSIDPQDVTVFGRSIKVPQGGRGISYVTPPELAESHLKYRESLKEDQLQILSLNPDAVGNPDTAERNAQAQALSVSMAVQQAGPAVLSRRKSLTEWGNVYLTTLRKNVSDERLIRTVGAAEASLVADTKYWTGKKLGPVGGVIVEEVSPFESTPQGRQAILESYIAQGMQLSIEDQEQVRNTGRLESVLNPARDEKLLIQAENEMLLRGEMPVVHPTQNQPLHYKHNAAVLLSLTALKKPEVVRAVQQTLDARYAAYFGVPPVQYGPPGPDGQPTVLGQDPLYLDRQRFLMGQGPLPAPMPPPGMGPPGSGTPPPMPGEMSATEPPAPGAAVPGAPDVPLPDNPLSGQPLSLSAGPVQ